MFLWLQRKAKRTYRYVLWMDTAVSPAYRPYIVPSGPAYQFSVVIPLGSYCAPPFQVWYGYLICDGFFP